MSQSLVVVESPAKAKTIERYLGTQYKVLASYGHVRDLIPKSGAIEIEQDIVMRYSPLEKSEKAVKAIMKALKQADTLYLATDPDREGEAICWHLYELLKEQDVLKDRKVKRIIFHEITKKAVQHAIANPRELSHDLIDAQQTRRALDYLVGFNLSPLLWKKIQKGLSAGRVQSPALRLLVEREREIQAFQSKEYWTIDGALQSKQIHFTSRLSVFQGEKVEQFSFTSKREVEQVEKELTKVASGKLQVADVKKRQRRRNPVAPFITSTLQQESVKQLGFSAQKTMIIAQQLYEGVEIRSELVGLITYMRTDSVSLSQDALSEVRSFISERYGRAELPKQPRVFRTTTKNAQEAHECIRPTDIRLSPDALTSTLARDQHRLYDLIWKRFVASQMKEALYDTVSVTLAAGDAHMFRSSGSVLVAPGFLQVYQESTEEDATHEERGDLPPLEKGDTVDLKEIVTDQHFTEPPPRYSEATLVKALESFGIGRPSTYASIISTLINRKYAEIDRKRLVPTDVGNLVIDFLGKHFSDYIDYEFTARLEDQLDEIAQGEKDWIPLVKDFWSFLEKRVKEKENSVSRKEALQTRELGHDPVTQKPVSVKMGRYGPYVQLGLAEDEEKPRFAGLKKDQRIEQIDLEAALELLKLPRTIGQYEETDLVVAIGRYGPYVRHDGKFYSLTSDDDPYTITSERAIQIIEEKRAGKSQAIIKEFKEQGISLLKGRYGPYVTDGKKNASIPKKSDPESITLEDAQVLLAKLPAQRSKKKKRSKKKT